MQQNRLDGQGLTRRIGRNLVLFKIPVCLLGLLLLMMLWEIVRANLDADVRKTGIWSLSLLDRQSVASLLAVSMGLIFARAQYAWTVRPLIGWRAEPRLNEYGMSSRHVWHVEMGNGGTHNVAVDEVEYRLRHFQGWDGHWMAHGEMVSSLERQGLKIGKDFDLNTIGQGAVLGDSVYVGRFSERAIHMLEDFEIRVRVTDAVGDRHERTLHCLRGAETELRSVSARS